MGMHRFIVIFRDGHELLVWQLSLVCFLAQHLICGLAPCALQWMPRGGAWRWWGGVLPPSGHLLEVMGHLEINYTKWPNEQFVPICITSHTPHKYPLKIQIIYSSHLKNQASVLSSMCNAKFDSPLKGKSTYIVQDHHPKHTNQLLQEFIKDNYCMVDFKKNWVK